MLTTWGERENVYVGCGLRAQNFGPTLRGEKADVVAIPGVWLDVDWGQEHKKPNLPPTEEDALTLITEMGPEPTMIIHSGRGLQAWWRFREPWILENKDERTKAERLTKGWCSTLRAKAKAHGWDADQVGDLPRVMRLPGLWNRKGIPKRTDLFQRNSEADYNQDDLDAYLLPDLIASNPLPKLDWKIIKRPDAEPPGAKLLILCENNAEFKRLCLRIPRQGQQDTSPSGFDFQLALLAFAANWTEQEIVNLLIAQRRTHHADLKLDHASYYETTLSAAVSGKDEESRLRLVENLRAGQTVPEQFGKDPAEILAVLSGVWGVQITKFVRFRGGSNCYQLEVEGQTVEIPSIDLIDSQTKFRRLILDHTDHLIAPIKAVTWNEMVQRLFSTVENVQVSTDSTRRGAYENWVSMYLSEAISGEDQWEHAACNNQPFHRNGQVYFVAEGFRLFLYTRFQERITSQQLTVELTMLGYHYERLNVNTRKGGRTKRSTWRVP
jgi:hypothetical protein